MMLANIDAMEGRIEEALVGVDEGKTALVGRWCWALNYRWLRACVHLAAVAHGVGDREAHLRRVEQDAKVLERPVNMLGLPIEFPGFLGAADFLHGRVAAARGDLDGARASLETAVAKVKPIILIFGPTFRACLGDLNQRA